jgi:antitoxin MazE
MQVSRWGNSLAVRLPAAVVEALGLQEGDEIAIEVADPRHFRVGRDPHRDAAFEALRILGWTRLASVSIAQRPTHAAHEQSILPRHQRAALRHDAVRSALGGRAHARC